MTWDTSLLTFDADAPTWDSSSWIEEEMAVYPDPSDVAIGVEYGPSGDDFVGTFAGGGGITGVVDNRVRGTTISLFTSETPRVSISIVDSEGESVTVTGLALSLVIERRSTTDLIVIADGSITKSGSTISFVVPSEATLAEGHHRWSLRDTSDDSVLLQGPFVVTYAPTVDA